MIDSSTLHAEPVESRWLAWARSLLADAVTELSADPSGGDPVQHALLLERYAVVQRDSSDPAAATMTLRRALDLLPADKVTRDSV